MAEQQPARSRRRVILDTETPVPIAWGDDERLGQPQIPRTAPVPRAAGGVRRTLSAPRRTVRTTRGSARAHHRPRARLPRRPRGVLGWSAVGLVIVAVVALAAFLVSLVLIQRGMP